MSCSALAIIGQRGVTTLLVIVLAGGLFDVPAAGQDMESPARFGEVLDVHLLELDVLVESRRGRPVLDLRRDDFEVFEDGERVDIVDFEPPPSVAGMPTRATRGAEPSMELGTGSVEAVERRSHDVVLAFDSESLDILRLARAVPEIERFVRSHAAEGHRWTVVLLGREPYAVTDWTSEAQEVAKGLQSILSALRGQPAWSWGVATFLDRVEIQSWGDRVAALLAEEASGEDAQKILDDADDRSARDVQTVLSDLVNCGSWSGVPPLATALSTRALLQSLIPGPGNRSLVLYYQESRNSAPRRMSAECITTAAKVKRGWQDAARAAQSVRFRVYGVDLSGLNIFTSSQVALYGVSTDGLSGMTAFRVQEGAQVSSTLTGGRDLHSNDWTSGLAHSFDDAANQYSLVVRVPHPHDGEEHSVKIRVKGRRGAFLRYRRSYTDLSRRQLLEAQLEQSGSVPRAGGEFPVAMRVETARAAAADTASVTVRLVAPLSRLGLVEQEGGASRAAAESWLAVYATPTDERISLHRTPGSVIVPPSEAEEAESATFSQLFELQLPAGDWTLVGAIYSPADDTAAVATERVRVARD